MSEEKKYLREIIAKKDIEISDLKDTIGLLEEKIEKLEMDLQYFKKFHQPLSEFEWYPKKKEV